MIPDSFWTFDSVVDHIISPLKPNSLTSWIARVIYCNTELTPGTLVEYLRSPITLKIHEDPASLHSIKTPNPPELHTQQILSGWMATLRQAWHSYIHFK